MVVTTSSKKIRELRNVLKTSQRELADRLQVNNLDIEKNAIQRIESGDRFVTDIELVAIARCFGVKATELLIIN